MSPDVPEVGLAHFFCASTQWKTSSKTFSSSSASSTPSSIWSPLEQPSKEALRLFIDHPGGVDLALCERVTQHLNHLRADYALEVSSPGPKYSNHKEIQ